MRLIMKLANLPHFATPYARPLNPSPPMARWLMPPNISEGESMAKSKTILFFFIFFSASLSTFQPNAILVNLPHFATPHG